MKKSSKRWSFRKFFLRVISLLAAVILSLVLYLGTSGVPDWLLADILQKVDTGPFALETSKLKLNLFGDLVFRDIRIYRKGIIGPPVLVAGRLDVVIDPFQMIRGESFVRGVRVGEGSICTPMLIGPDKPRAPLINMNLLLDILLENCVIDGMSLASFSTDLSCKGSIVSVDNMLVQWSDIENAETFRGVITYDDEKHSLNGHLETNFDPCRLLPYLRQREWEYLASLINCFEFRKAKPKGNIDFSKNMELDGDLYLTAEAWLPECRYRGIDVLRADGTVKVRLSKDDSFVRVDPLFVIRPEGNVRGGLTADLVGHDVKFKCVSTIQPDCMMKMADVYMDSFMDDWVFNGPVKVVAKGRVDYRDVSKRKLDLSFDGRNAGLGGHLADECSFEMEMLDHNILLTNIVGRIYEGDFAGTLGFVLPNGIDTNVHYKVDMKLDKISAPKVLAVIANKDIPDIEGEFYMTIGLHGVVGPESSRTVKGGGNAGIKNGRVFSLPVFGGLSSIMRNVIPGLDFVLRQSEFKTDFSIADGRVHCDDVKVEGDILSLSAQGDYYFGGRLDFDARVKLMKAHTVGGKLMRVITYPISKLFQFRLTGTSDEPKWYPVNFSTDLLEKLGLKKSVDR